MSTCSKPTTISTTSATAAGRRPGERRVAIIELGHPAIPRAIAISPMVTDPDAGVRQQVALALGEFDGPQAAAALASCWSIRNRPWRRPRPTAWPNEGSACADGSCRWSLMPMPLSDGCLRALKELRQKDTLKPALDALRTPTPRCAFRPSA